MDCQLQPELDLEIWGEMLLKPLGGERYPLSGGMELTSRCNLSCLHCYINKPANCGKSKEKELTTGEIKDILDQAANAGCLFLLMTGGEPLIRPDFSEIYSHARRNGILITLFTNGTLVTHAILDVLTDMPPVLVEVTVYGATEGTYEAVTGVKGSYKRFIKGLDLLSQSGLRFALKTVLLTKNKHELSQMAKMAEDRNINFRYDGTIWPRLDREDGPYHYKLDVNGLLELDRLDRKRQDAWNSLYERTKGLPMRSEKIYSCGAGYRTFHIDSAGKMSVCIMARTPAYDVFEKGFESAWEKLGAERSRIRQVNSPCQSCSAAGICMQCPGWSQLAHGDSETPVDFVCQLAKQREIQILQQLPIKEEMIIHE